MSQCGGQKIQAGQANENGDVEQRHYRFKQAADQALLMRGSRDFPAVAAYQVFLSKLFTRLNAGRRERYLDEVAQLRPLSRAAARFRTAGTGASQSVQPGDGSSKHLFGA